MDGGESSDFELIEWRIYQNGIKPVSLARAVRELDVDSFRRCTRTQPTRT